MNHVIHWKQAATWARSLSDAELTSNLESLRAELVAYPRCPFYEGHPECQCEERLPARRILDDRFDLLRLEMLNRHGMTAHEKMARIAAARAKQEVAP